jgi:hypothetical protein
MLDYLTNLINFLLFGGSLWFNAHVLKDIFKDAKNLKTDEDKKELLFVALIPLMNIWCAYYALKTLIFRGNKCF